MLNELIERLKPWNPNGMEIADALWLAVHWSQVGAVIPAIMRDDINNEGKTSPVSDSEEDLSDIGKNKRDESASQARQSQATTTDLKKINLYAGKFSLEADGFSRGQELRIAAATALPDKIALGRALRPLKRRVPSRLETILDVERTVARMADENIYIPVFRRKPDKWLDLVFVVDCSPTMAPWMQTVREFTTFLERTGIFRRVLIYSLVPDTDDSRQFRLMQGIATEEGHRRCQKKELLFPGGTRAILIFSDGIGNAWENGNMATLLATWSRIHPSAIAQPLPSRLWSRTAFGVPTRSWRFPWPAATNEFLIPDRPLRRLAAVSSLLPIPLLALDAETLKQWTGALAAKHGCRVPGILLSTVPTTDTIDPVNEVALEPSASERYALFTRYASSEAQELLTCLAPFSPTLPIFRIIQNALISKPKLSQIAEILASGLLVRVSPNGTPIEQTIYEYADGVENILREGLTHERSQFIFNTISNYVEHRFGISLKEFIAFAHDTEANEVLPSAQPGAARPFARISRHFLESNPASKYRLSYIDTWPPQVLWVDDNPNNNATEQSILEHRGLEFTLASTTREALQLLEKTTYSLVISDMRRGKEVDAGLTLLAYIRERGWNIPFFFHTISIDTGIKIACDALGILGCSSQFDSYEDLVRKAFIKPDGSYSEAGLRYLDAEKMDTLADHSELYSQYTSEKLSPNINPTSLNKEQLGVGDVKGEIDLLSEDQFKQLHYALLKAFPQYTRLEFFVTVELEENLTAITEEASLFAATFNLIRWATARDRLWELVEKAWKQDPNNPELRTFMESFFGIPVIPSKTTSPTFKTNDDQRTTHVQAKQIQKQEKRSVTDPKGHSFLCYRRSRHSEAELLIAAQHDVGIPTWQDITNLEEAPLEREIRQVLVDAKTANAILWLTPDFKDSDFIQSVEAPMILNRADADTRDAFFVTPVLAGGLDHADLSSLLRPETSRHDLTQWSVRRVKNDPITLEDAAQVAQWVLQRRLKAIHEAEAGGNPLSISFDTRQLTADAPDRALMVDWRHRFQGGPQSPGRQALPDAWEKHLLPALTTLAAAIQQQAPGRALEVRGQATLSAALALGHTFSGTRRAPVVWKQYRPHAQEEDWSLGAERQACGFNVHIRPGDVASTDLAVKVSVTQSADPIFDASGPSLPRFRAIVEITPPSGFPHTLDAGQAADLAALFREAVLRARNEYRGTTRLHLFLVVPVGLAMLIGQQLNTLGPVQMYEHDEVNNQYAPSVLLLPPS